MIKDIIIQYAPTALTLISSFTAFIKIGSALKKQKNDLVNSSEILDLKLKMKTISGQISALNKELSDYDGRHDHEEI